MTTVSACGGDEPAQQDQVEQQSDTDDQGTPDDSDDQEEQDDDSGQDDQEEQDECAGGGAAVIVEPYCTRASGPPVLHAGTMVEPARLGRLHRSLRLPARPVRRLVQLYLGLLLYGVSMALMVRSSLGVMPWDVLHQGLARQLGWSLGLVTVAVGVVVLLGWIPLRERPGIGTVSNIFVVGLAVDAALSVLAAPDGLPARLALAAAGIGLNGVATAAYIGVSLGPGPRDGLMTGLVRRTGGSVRVVRTSIEVAVVAAGWLLGGTLGVVTVLYAVSIGPLAHILLPRFTVALPQPAGPGPEEGP